MSESRLVWKSYVIGNGVWSMELQAGVMNSHGRIETLHQGKGKRGNWFIKGSLGGI